MSVFSLQQNDITYASAMSKNTITMQHLKIVCRSMQELRKAGMTENFAIRHLEFLTNNYAKQIIIGKLSPDHADEYALWSKAALSAKIENVDFKYGQYLRVEHGTPRRKFARIVLKAHEDECLTQEWMDAHCQALWKVAVITHEEDKRLNRVAKLIFDTPEARWAAAGIEF